MKVTDKQRRGTMKTYRNEQDPINAPPIYDGASTVANNPMTRIKEQYFDTTKYNTAPKRTQP